MNKEQLELAAKACGIEIFGFYGDDTNPCIYADIGPAEVHEWNPLTDQADSDRMACDLEIDTFFSDGFVTCRKLGYQGKIAIHDGTIEGRRAAVREARLLVAVEIGRVMK